MEQAIAKAPEAQVEEEESLSLVAERAALSADHHEIKGRIYDLQFDNLNEDQRKAAEQKIYDDHAAKEAKYKADVKAVQEKIADLNAQVKALQAEYAQKVQDIQKSETDPSDEEKAAAKATYDASLKSENDNFDAQIAKLSGEINEIKAASKQKDSELRSQYATVKRTPMKRADKATQLDALKSEIYKNSGNADLEVLNRSNAIKKLRLDHKKAQAKLSNDLHLKTDHVNTMVRNAKAEEKQKIHALHEERAVLYSDYRPVAPFFSKVGLGIADWGERWWKRQKTSFSSWRGFNDWFIHNAVYLIIIAMVIYTAVAQPSWLNFDSFISIVKHTSSLLPLALGVAGTIVLTGTDLSLGRIWGFTALLAGSFLGYASTSGVLFGWTAEMPWIWILVVLLLVMAFGGLCGFLNGFFVAEFSIHPFVVTLATQLIIYGGILLYGKTMGNLSVIFKADNSIANAYYSFVTGGFTIGGTLIEWYNVYAVLMLIVMSFIWYKTKFGKAMFAVGCNPDAANVSGINVKKTIIWTFVLAGIFYGIGGFEYNPINGGAQLSTGTGGELDPITAVVIGGVSFTGGIGKVSGVLLGCLLLKVIDSCLLAIGAETAYINILKGAIILFAVALDMKKYIVKK
jgi:methyl-galactoside transport system permease protein